MKLKISILLAAFFVIFISGCVEANSDKKKDLTEYKSEYVKYSEDELWNRTVKKYINSNLWNERDRYDAGHFLMVPMHYAFQTENKELIAVFQKHFEAFLNEGINEIDISDDSQRLSILHYYYLLSRYLVLSENINSNNEVNRVNKELTQYLLKEIDRIWNEIPAWQWDSPYFKEGMRERVLWKLKNKEVDYSYYRAIIDEELFTMAIAADLYQLNRKDKMLLDIVNIAYKTFKSEGHFDKSNRWLFQIGVWDDHPDYSYAGYLDKENVKKEKPITDTAMDSSHFHRFPLWIKSLEDAFLENTKEKKMFSKINKGIEKQLFEKVLVVPTKSEPFYKLTNYMDGTNGLFRWNYSTSKGDGHGPYELSGTFAIGWWTFLGSDRVKKVYANMYHSFPLSDQAVKLYIGPNTTRDRNIYIADPESYYNGYKELLALLASKIK
ncbi:hypothetical protein [Metasolibacillus sp.]|uniref:hypothetical protein n=1 Tax=Metasolibacillus sp. TaxID=2703680 RepID=UPI0025E3C336|nr:hypothetical protein [Metasolibacillus sp.]MCT6923382.1 hypothetical protein [Metasolibacillus sp.]MCT6939895.1 hypothetical protein [Metasolibacillus sp.]